MRIQICVNEEEVVGGGGPDQRRIRTGYVAHPEHPQLVEHSQPGQGHKVVRKGRYTQRPNRSRSGDNVPRHVPITGSKSTILHRRG